MDNKIKPNVPAGSMEGGASEPPTAPSDKIPVAPEIIQAEDAFDA